MEKEETGEERRTYLREDEIKESILAGKITEGSANTKDGYFISKEKGA